MNPVGFILIAIGLFSFAGGLFNWNWFMNTRRARALVRSIRPVGARVFYMVLGMIVIVFGVFVSFNGIGGN
ncbi:MAG: hypothetical protein GQ524_05165 [Anaerolineales bacterium]|nr:hypothetical protein [Anaerolineales bacterium]